MLGSLLVYITQGIFPLDVFAVGITAILILTVIQIIRRKRKKDNVPEVDERVAHNVFRYHSYMSHFAIAILFIAVAILTLLEMETISILYLWIFFVAYLWMVGIGAIFIKRR